MGFVLETDGSAGAAFATKTIPTLSAPWYIQFDLYIPQTTLDALIPSAFSTDFIELGDSSQFDGIFLAYNGSVWQYWTDQTSDPQTGTFTGDIWHVIKIEYDGTNITWKADGVTLFTPYAIAISLDGIQFGDQFAASVSPEIHRYDNLRIGTTPGGFDIFNEDFSTGDLSQWSSTTGSISVITAPDGPSAITPFSVPCGILMVQTSDGVGYLHDDFTPALYNVVNDPYADIWTRVTFRNDLGGGTVEGWPLVILGFAEWIADPVYYGDWWQIGGFALRSDSNVSTATATPWGMSAISTPTEALGYRGPVTGPGGGIEVYDMHLHYLGDITVTGVLYSRWLGEAYRNGVLIYDQVWRVHADPGKPPFHGAQAIVILDQYGNLGSPTHGLDHGYIYLDDISVGTGQGVDDLMSVQTFDSGSFGAFILDLGNLSTMEEAFHVSSSCGGILWFFKDGIWRNAGADPDYNIYFNRDGSWRQVRADTAHNIHGRLDNSWQQG